MRAEVRQCDPLRPARAAGSDARFFHSHPQLDHPERTPRRTRSAAEGPTGHPRGSARSRSRPERGSCTVIPRRIAQGARSAQRAEASQEGPPGHPRGSARRVERAPPPRRSLQPDHPGHTAGPRARSPSEGAPGRARGITRPMSDHRRAVRAHSSPVRIAQRPARGAEVRQEGLADPLERVSSASSVSGRAPAGFGRGSMSPPARSAQGRRPRRGRSVPGRRGRRVRCSALPRPGRHRA